jgi:hypothetical protein
MKEIKYTVLYCVCEKFCDTVYYSSGSGSCSGTLINYGSGSDFLARYGFGSGSASQKVSVPTVPVPQRCYLLLPLLCLCYVKEKRYNLFFSLGGGGHRRPDDAVQQGRVRAPVSGAADPGDHAGAAQHHPGDGERRSYLCHAEDRLHVHGAAGACGRGHLPASRRNICPGTLHSFLHSVCRTCYRCFRIRINLFLGLLDPHPQQ